ncbi:MAG: hypothetical protein RL726_1569 [Actinomycetota bacterium]|jgi:hypothetical protein
MAFGQPAGPPASKQQLNELLELLQAAGHSDFRDARGPLQFNQRQAAGRFTRQEADDFINQLRAEAEFEEAIASTRGSEPTPAKPSPQRLTADEKAARALPDSVLAAELQSRGWIVVEP